jgi:hypothetical protein
MQDILLHRHTGRSETGPCPRHTRNFLKKVAIFSIYYRINCRRVYRYAGEIHTPVGTSREIKSKNIQEENGEDKISGKNSLLEMQPLNVLSEIGKKGKCQKDLSDIKG